MPILWRYLLSNYLQVFSLSVFAFVAVLLVTRFQDIARFTASKASLGSIALFTLYQIPHILPFAIPISCLIAALLLFQRLSRFSELTAMRAAGLSLGPIAFPLVAMGSLIFLLNLAICSEVTPLCRTKSKQLIYEMTVANPFILLQKDSPVKLKNTFFDLKSLKEASTAKDVIVASKNEENARLTLFMAKQLSLQKELISGSQITILSSLEMPLFDHLVIENQATMQTKASYISHVLSPPDDSYSTENLTIRSLIAKRLCKKTQKVDWVLLEILRRSTLGLAALTFTLLGVAYGMQIGRRASRKGLYAASALAAAFMLSYMIAKTLSHHYVLSSLLYLLPQGLLVIFSLFTLKKVARGAE